jgi:hypothetical protein
MTDMTFDLDEYRRGIDDCISAVVDACDGHPERWEWAEVSGVRQEPDGTWAAALLLASTGRVGIGPHGPPVFIGHGATRTGAIDDLCRIVFDATTSWR